MKKNDRLDNWLAAWDQASSSPLPVEYRAFFFCFNRGDYYEAHDVLEHLWLRCRDTNRLFFQGLIQFAGAFVHLQKHHLFPEHPTHSRRLGPARRLFTLAATNLEGYGPVHFELHLPALLSLGTQWSAIAADGENPLGLLPPPVLTLGAPEFSPLNTPALAPSVLLEA